MKRVSICGILAEDGGLSMPVRVSCAVDSALKIIGDRWTLAIIHELTLGPRRTVELYRGFKGLSTKTLLARLRKLDRREVVERRSYSESPPRVEYSLTDKGRALMPLVREIGRSALLWEELKGHDPECKACAALTIEAASPTEQLTRAMDTSEVVITGPAEPEIKRQQVRKRRDITLL